MTIDTLINMLQAMKVHFKSGDIHVVYHNEDTDDYCGLIDNGNLQEDSEFTRRYEVIGNKIALITIANTGFKHYENFEQAKPKAPGCC